MGRRGEVLDRLRHPTEAVPHDLGTMIRTVAGVALLIPALLLVSALVVVLALLRAPRRVIDRCYTGFADLAILIGGTHVETRGLEHMRPGASYVVVANHLSSLDIMACFLAVRIPIRYLAKKELFRVPILAQGMRAVGIIEVDRDARSAIHSEVNRQAKQLIAKKRSLIIYAEGTRPRNGLMRPFKKGAFTMAIASGLPILPVSIHGTYEAFRPGRPWVRGGKVKVIVDPAIDTEGAIHATGNLQAEVVGHGTIIEVVQIGVDEDGPVRRERRHQQALQPIVGAAGVGLVAGPPARRRQA